MTPEGTPDPERVRRYFDGQAAGYTDRSSGWMWRFVRDRESRAIYDLVRPRPGERILDAGSGAGHYSALMVGAGARVTALDFSGAMLAALRQRLDIDTVEGDLATVVLEPVFDKVLCVGALEFVPDPRVAVANLAKALRPDGPGEIVLHLPARSLGGWLYRRFHRGHGFTVNLFTRADVEGLIPREPAFRIDTLRGVTFNLALRLRRLPAPSLERDSPHA